MPYQVTWEHHGVHVVFSGATQAGEFLKIAQEFSHDFRLKEIRYILANYLGCDSTAFCLSLAAELAVISDRSQKRENCLKIALVTDIPELIALASAYLEASMCQDEMGVFQTLAEARAWCG